MSGRDLVFYVNAEGNLCARNLKVLPDLPASLASPEQEPHSTHLHIPNLFKHRPRSSEHLPSHDNRFNLKVFLDDPQELGQLSLNSSLCGFKLCPGMNDLFGIVWTETELMVRPSSYLIYSYVYICDLGYEMLRRI
jgi:hypothetical protein